MKQAIDKVAPELQLPSSPPAWARLGGAEDLRTRMEAAGFQGVEVVTSTATQRIDSPEAYWSGFTRSAPPLAALFGRLGPERTAAVGREYIAALRAEPGAQAGDGVPTLSVEACIGLGRS